MIRYTHPVLLAALVVILSGAPVAAIPVYEVGVESLVGSILIAPARLEDWHPDLAFPDGFPPGLVDTDANFVCPATYRCQYNVNGWSVLIETSISITPGSGTLSLESATTTATEVPEPSTLALLVASLAVLGVLVNPAFRRY
jgi:hypothetical protein